MKSQLLRAHLSCCVLALLLTALQSSFAQNTQTATPPLNFGNNFFVTGDYVVAGAYNMAKSFTTINGVSYAVGTINVPDSNPGIQGATSVPKGAQVLAALLYWQTVETQGLTLGGPGTGANGYFRPLLYSGTGGPPAPGYSIQGTPLDNENTNPVPTGCSGTVNGKVIQTYRADVGGGFPVDANGNPISNGSFEVRLPSTNNGQPFTLGATLVIIYRIPTGTGGPNIPLNSIVIYDGDFAQNNAHPTMNQSMQGFYDADAKTISRLTHIVASGASNKFETVYLGSTNPPSPLVALSSPYGSKPSFPGWYGNWDNTTWAFPSGSSPLPVDSSTATTQVVQAAMNQACPSWGAIIMSTTVRNPDNDGILYSWKMDPRGPGYCDASINNGSCTGPGDPAWVDLTGAATGHHDVFLQYDYMCSSVTGPGKCDSNIAKDLVSTVTAGPSPGQTTYTGTITHPPSKDTVVGIAGFSNPANEGQFTVVSSNSSQLVVNNPSGVFEADRTGVATYAIAGDQNYSFDPRLAIDPFNVLNVDHNTAVDKVVDSYANENGSSSHHTPIVLHAVPGNAIAENQTPISCLSSDPTCVFPNEPGTVGFRAGLSSIKNTTIETTTGVIGGCTVGAADCVPVFQHGKKDSYHYALFSHGVGLPSLYLSDGSIQSVTQSGNTVTFTTKAPHGISQIVAQPNYATATDTTCGLGRVTVIAAITNTNLNGTFCVLSSPAPTANTFSISVGNKTTATYTAKTDPNLSVASGQVTSISGLSDLGGGASIISLGYGGWGPPTNPFADGNQWPDKAGTFMHELGHTMFLSHGGTFYNNYKPLASPPVIDYTPTYEVNCKPNLQSNMSYLFQFDLLQDPSAINPDGTPLKVVDYSEEALSTLVESDPQATGVLSGAFYATTAWFELQSADKSGSLMSTHCDFTPLLAGDPPTVAVPQSPVGKFGWSSTNGLDINFNGTPNTAVPAGDTMHGHNEWAGTPAEADGSAGPSPGVDLRQVSALGTLSAVGLGGAQGGLKPLGGGLKPLGGGLKPLGGGLKPLGGAEMTHEQACSYPRPPQNLIVQEEASPRNIDLNWLAPSVCQPLNYNVYQSVAGGPFTFRTTVSGTQTTFQDTVTCNPGGYSYQVKAVINNPTPPPPTLESVPSNTVPAPGEPLVTGCYTAPVTVAVEATGVQGDIVPVTWTLTDDFFATPPAPWSGATAGNPVTNKNANTLVAMGPDPANSCAAGGQTTILANGSLTAQSGASTFSVDANGNFTLNLDTDALCAGSYTFKLTLDSNQSATSSTLKLGIDVNDQDTPKITTLALPAGTVGLAYNDTLTEDGGTPPLTWTVTGLPSQPSPGISQVPAGSANLSGTTCVAGTYNPVTATVTDAKSNTGTQAFSLLINKANTTTTVISNANPSVFQQPVTFTVTVAAPGSCTPQGNVTLSIDNVPFGSPQALSSTGTTSFPVVPTMQFYLSVGTHSVKAVYAGNANFNGSDNTMVLLLQKVNPASTAISLNPVPSPAFVGQPITVSYTFGVVAPGAGSPIGPTGSITVSATDNAVPTPHNSSCVVTGAPYLALGGGMCTLSPPPPVAGTYVLTINYPGDGNFVQSGANGGYSVYQLVFTAQPSNTGVGNTITPAVAVTAEDSSNNPLTSFTGGVTVGIGSGSGTLTGTLTQNAVAGVATFGDLSINKIGNNYTLTAAPSGGVPDATSNAFNIDTFYVDVNGNFGTLDLPTGKGTQIGAAPAVPGANGIDLKGLQVYAYTASNQLFQIATSTGVATQVGSGTTGSIPNQATTGALTTGSYFAIDAVTGILYSIDTTAGTTTQVGTGTGAATLPAGCTLDSSLTGSATVLYYTIGYSGANCVVNNQPAQMPDTLYLIDPTTGLVTGSVQLSIGSPGGPGVNEFVGSAYVGGTLYGFTNTGQEYTIDATADANAGVATLPKTITPAGTSIVGTGSQ